jgi:hypothetical protein
MTITTSIVLTSNQSPYQILDCPLKMNTGRKQIKYGCGYVYVETVLVIKHGALASQSLLPNVEKKNLFFKLFFI